MDREAAHRRQGAPQSAAAPPLTLTLACVNDIIALVFSISLNATTWIFRIGLLVLPIVAYYVAYRVCIGLQRADRAVLEHGIETGVLKRLPHGEYIEVHQPLGPVDDHGHPIPLEYQGAAIPKKMNKLGSAGKPGSGTWFRADPPHQAKALAETEHAGELEQLKMLSDYQDKIHGNGASQNGHSSNGHAESSNGEAADTPTVAEEH
jgi:ubiquinol-cytochrome c reductase cytochrome b subunit